MALRGEAVRLRTRAETASTAAKEAQDQCEALQEQERRLRAELARERDKGSTAAHGLSDLAAAGLGGTRRQPQG